MSLGKKYKRKSITLDIKINILDHLAGGMGSTAVGRLFGLNEGTVRSIKKNEIAIRRAVYAGAGLNAKSTSYTRDIMLEKTEEVLIMWIDWHEHTKGFVVDGASIKTMAKKIFCGVKEYMLKFVTLQPQQPPGKDQQFFASNGWLRRFFKRYDLEHIKMRNTLPTEEVDTELNDNICGLIDRVCASDNIWNTDDMTNDYYTKRCRIKKEIIDEEEEELEGEPVDIFETEEEDRKVFDIPLNDDVHFKDPLQTNNENFDYIEKGLQLAKELVDHFIKYDSNKQRTEIFKNNINKLMNNYKELNNN
uniref:HTH CENPB-type domain-containing protein n=1 Tax=Glossina brevipalpis TaxID=37001 RepID=A0A1A9WHU2_9MUSC